ncbi:hypothetical protein GCM10025777_03970 [Membranihabitans marinus]
MAISKPRFQYIHPNVEPVIAFPTMVTPTVKGVKVTKFLDNGRWIKPKNNAEIIIPPQIMLLDGYSDWVKYCKPAIISDINPMRKIISSVIPAENATRA